MNILKKIIISGVAFFLTFIVLSLIWAMFTGNLTIPDNRPNYIIRNSYSVYSVDSYIEKDGCVDFLTYHVCGNYEIEKVK
jgi:hypothetical protein